MFRAGIHFSVSGHPFGPGIGDFLIFRNPLCTGRPRREGYPHSGPFWHFSPKVPCLAQCSGIHHHHVHHHVHHPVRHHCPHHPPAGVCLVPGMWWHRAPSQFCQNGIFCPECRNSGFWPFQRRRAAKVLKEGYKGDPISLWPGFGPAPNAGIPRREGYPLSGRNSSS